MKIALSGPSGTGKTTLCKFIEEEFSVDHVSSSAGDLLTPADKELLRKRYGYNSSGHSNVIRLSATHPPFGLEFQNLVALRRSSMIALSNSGIVTDRSAIDNMVYYALQVAHQYPEHFFNELLSTALPGFKALSHLILLSLNNPEIEDNNSRVANMGYQTAVSGAFSSIYYRYFQRYTKMYNIKVLHVDFWDLEQRKDLIKRFLST